MQKKSRAGPWLITTRKVSQHVEARRSDPEFISVALKNFKVLCNIIYLMVDGNKQPEGADSLHVKCLTLVSWLEPCTL